MPGFVVGENVLLFLERNGEHGLLRVVGMAQGRFVLQRDPGGQVWVEQDLTGLALAKVTGENAKGKKTTSLVGPVQPVRMELRRMLVEVGQALKRVDLQLHPDVQEKLGPRLDHAYDFSFELGEVKR